MRLLRRIPWAGWLALIVLLQTPYSPLRHFRPANLNTQIHHPAGFGADDRGPRANVIYGADDRMDIEDITDPALLALANSTAAMVKSADIQPAGNGRSRLRAIAYGPAFNLCRDERFFDQPAAADCSGFLVARDVLATAGHCVPSPARCKLNSWVFSFEIDGSGRDMTVVDDADVYSCKALIGSLQHPNGSDWALVKLDRPVAGRAPLALRRSGRIAKGEDVVLIGHPSGLPKKIAGGAQARDTDSSAFFVAETDSYGGNSGSPVFNARTLEVEGILVRGEVDFEQSGACMRSKHCAHGQCSGEEVTRVSEFLGKIPN